MPGTERSDERTNPIEPTKINSILLQSYSTLQMEEKVDKEGVPTE